MNRENVEVKPQLHHLTRRGYWMTECYTKGAWIAALLGALLGVQDRVVYCTLRFNCLRKQINVLFKFQMKMKLAL